MQVKEKIFDIDIVLVSLRSSRFLMITKRALEANESLP